jgi:hypothetical protein
MASAPTAQSSKAIWQVSDDFCPNFFSIEATR